MKKRFSPVFRDFPHIVHGADYNPDQWLSRPDILSEDLRLMKLAGMNSATLAIFAWSAIEPEEGVFRLEWLDKIIDELYAQGSYVVLATPSAARPAWLDAKYPEAMRTHADGLKETHGRRHNHCMSSPIFREKVRIIDTALAEHYKDNPAVKLWHISNEFSGECFCPLCRENFRKFLRKRYLNDINLLNEQWWSAFWSHTYTSFDQIDPPSYLGETSLYGLNLDWKRYTTDITCDFMQAEIDTVKAITPDIPVTTNMMGTYPGIDYWKMAKHLDVASWDAYPQFDGTAGVSDSDLATSIGMVHSLTRSLLHKPFMIMESTPSAVNWVKPVCRMKRPGVHYLSSMQMIGHGSDTIQYFQWRKSRGGEEKFHGAVVDHEGSEHSRVFREVAKLGEDLKKLDEIVGTDTKSQAAIIFDWENRWALDTFMGLRTYRGYVETVAECFGGFFNHAVNVEFLPADGDFSSYKLVVAPMLYALSEETIDKLERYVREGGTLVATYLTGYVNENDLCFLGGFPGGKLRKVFGIWNEEIDCLRDDQTVRCRYEENELGLSGEFSAKHFCEVLHLEGAKTIASYEEDFYAEMPVITVNSYGRGRAYYIGARQSKEELEKLIVSVCSKEKVVRIVPDTLPEGVKVISRTDYENEYIFITNYNTDNRTVDLGDRAGIDLLTGRHLCGKIEIAPRGVFVLKCPCRPE